MTQEFYRGGTRSAFASAVVTGNITWASGGVTVIPIQAAVDGSQVLRLKRVQIAVQAPKDASGPPGHGWGAFIRVPEGFTPEYPQLNPGDPTVLRAKPFLLNADHAVYFENYLEAINIDGGGTLLYYMELLQGSTTNWTFSVRHTAERQVG